MFAIVPKWPKGELVLRDIKVKAGAEITLLGTDITIDYQQKGKNLVLKVPYLTPDELPCEYAWTFKISQ